MPAMFGGASARALIHARDKKTASTVAATVTTGAWRTRELTELVVDQTGGASLASNQLTVPAGTYEVWARAGMAYAADYTALRVYDATGAAVKALGCSHVGGASDRIQSICVGRFTLAVASAIEVQQQVGASAAGGAIQTYQEEVYAEILLWKVA